ncbi:7161_t:CDS:1, partial [Scutellospora calospora]
ERSENLETTVLANTIPNKEVKQEEFSPIIIINNDNLELQELDHI